MLNSLMVEGKECVSAIPLTGFWIH